MNRQRASRQPRGIRSDTGIRSRQTKLKEPSIQKEERVTNRGADLIARSVTKKLRTRSYVATGAPVWLRHIFDSERSSPSTRRSDRSYGVMQGVVVSL
ncbi:hypothetical protein Bca4012_069500 [Brassica carinata]